MEFSRNAPRALRPNRSHLPALLEPQSEYFMSEKGTAVTCLIACETRDEMTMNGTSGKESEKQVRVIAKCRRHTEG